MAGCDGQMDVFDVLEDIEKEEQSKSRISGIPAGFIPRDPPASCVVVPLWNKGSSPR